MFAVFDDTRVGSVTNCDNEKTEQKSRKSLACTEEDDKTGGELCQLMLGKLKSPRRNNGYDGNRVMTILTASCKSLTKVDDEDGER